MKTSIATVTLSGNLEQKLEAVSAAGFYGVEIFENDFLVFDRSPKDVGQMVRDAGLAITLFQPFRDFEGMPEPHRSRAFERAERKFDVMEQLGADLMLVCSSISRVALGGVDRAAGDLAELGEHAAARGLRVGYEALAWGRYINDHRDAWEIVRRADHPSIGLILDSFHTLARGINVDSITSIPREKIFLVQLADAPKFDMDLLFWSRHFRNMPGEGDLPVRDFMSAVAQTGYDGVLSLEIFNDQFRGGSPGAIARDGQRSLVALMDDVHHTLPHVSVPRIEMPPKVNVHGVEFVEFAASEEEAKDLIGLLETMGFRHAGTHRSKKVELYRQGDINLVINTQEDGFAQTSWRVHGTSAYAIGLQVDDAEAAVQRSMVLGAEAFTEPAREGELEMPAIRGAGGLIYFLDGKSPLARVWELEFELADTPDSDDHAGLIRIDHLAQTLGFDEFLTWLLFYSSIFAVSKTPMVDIPDPAGLIRSQVVENEAKSLRITLNGAANRRTLAGRFIREQFGPGIQHIAFETDDIFGAAEQLTGFGFRPLEISANYFDDVEARFGLDPEFADRLRAASILYDQDESGEYLQLFSATFRESFFFEVVERRGGYDGYGGSNAPFRIAAQQRMLGPDRFSGV